MKRWIKYCRGYLAVDAISFISHPDKHAHRAGVWEVLIELNSVTFSMYGGSGEGNPEYVKFYFSSKEEAEAAIQSILDYTSEVTPLELKDTV